MQAGQDAGSSWSLGQTWERAAGDRRTASPPLCAGPAAFNSPFSMGGNGPCPAEKGFIHLFYLLRARAVRETCSSPGERAHNEQTKGEKPPDQMAAQKHQTRAAGTGSGQRPWKSARSRLSCQRSPDPAPRPPELPQPRLRSLFQHRARSGRSSPAARNSQLVLCCAYSPGCTLLSPPLILASFKDSLRFKFTQNEDHCLLENCACSVGSATSSIKTVFNSPSIPVHMLVSMVQYSLLPSPKVRGR